MAKRILFLLPMLFPFLCMRAQERNLVRGMSISRTVTIKKRIYCIDAGDNQDQPVISIQGNNITIDFNNAELKGSNTIKLPNGFFGVAILIQNSKNVTIKNLKASGYKIAFIAKHVEKLTLENCDFSYNYRPHLNSTQEREDVSDWLSYHHNEQDQWLRYGAAIYLRNCHFAVIRNCKVTGGQNALMLMECNDGMIYNNDFSFNSGIGLGMYRCNRNKVMYNRINFNVRGYSDGVYNRGQDSAGILVYEQSNDNVFYKNCVTHSGDGFFLWAGQTTMDSGKGGCNDNVLWGNDFSYAPTNGVEVTFSRNLIAHNRIFECDNGIWGGYSFESTISNNQFRDNNVAIAIEHGQQNKIGYNIFSKDNTAIKLWGRNEAPSDWGYPRYRDTKSRDYIIVYNSFNRQAMALDFSHTNGLNVFNNTVNFCDQFIRIDSTVLHLDTTYNDELDFRISLDTTIIRSSIPKPNNPFKGIGILAGRKNILITEWGPYDFRSPIIWNSNPTDASDTMKFDMLGPKGKWRIRSSRGIENISAMSGVFPSSIIAKRIKDERTDIFIELEYEGVAITTPFGETIEAGKTYLFSFRKFFQPMNWDVLFYPLDTANYNPIKTGQLFSSFEKKAPFKTEKVNRLDYAWWGGINADYQHTQFIIVADATATIPKGTYELSVTWDDAVRVYIDDKLVIDEWNPSLYDFDESPNRKIRLNLGGNHHFKVEHVELGGFASLGLKIIPVE